MFDAYNLGMADRPDKDLESKCMVIIEELELVIGALERLPKSVDDNRQWLEEVKAEYIAKGATARMPPAKKRKCREPLVVIQYPEIMEIKMAKEYLGVSYDVLRRMIIEKEVPAVKKRGRWRIWKCDLDEWAKTNPVPPQTNT